MENKGKDNNPEWSDDDRAVFIPDEDMRANERVLHNMEQAELRKIREGMNTMENEE
jgi:hypothetical protein